MSLIKHLNKLKFKTSAECYRIHSLSYYSNSAIKSSASLAPDKSNNYLKLCKQTAITSKPQSVSCFPLIYRNFNHQSCRYFASSKPARERILPDFGRRVRLGPDSTFTKKEFFEGAKVALQVISRKLSAADIEGLKELVDKDTLDGLARIISTMSPAQRSNLAVDKEDILFCVPYEVQLITKETTEHDLTKYHVFVEIMMVYYVSKGGKELKAGGLSLSNIEKVVEASCMLCSLKL